METHQFKQNLEKDHIYNVISMFHNYETMQIILCSYITSRIFKGLKENTVAKIISIFLVLSISINS